MAKRLSFDLTDEDFEGFKLAEEGWHNVEITEGEEVQSSNGNLQYKLKYRSTDDTFKGTVQEFLTITPKTIRNVATFCKAAEADVIPTTADPSIPEVDDLIGKTLAINIEHNEDSNGKTDEDGKVRVYANVKFFGYRTVSANKGVKTSSGAKAKAGAKSAGFSL